MHRTADARARLVRRLNASLPVPDEMRFLLTLSLRSRLLSARLAHQPLSDADADLLRHLIRDLVMTAAVTELLLGLFEENPGAKATVSEAKAALGRAAGRWRERRAPDPEDIGRLEALADLSHDALGEVKLGEYEAALARAGERLGR